VIKTACCSNQKSTCTNRLLLTRGFAPTLGRREETGPTDMRSVDSLPYKASETSHRRKINLWRSSNLRCSHCVSIHSPAKRHCMSILLSCEKWRLQNQTSANVRHEATKAERPAVSVSSGGYSLRAPSGLVHPFLYELARLQR
jgi:hypothetical protein